MFKFAIANGCTPGPPSVPVGCSQLPVPEPPAPGRPRLLNSVRAQTGAADSDSDGTDCRGISERASDFRSQ
jgi:hypothetical protein